VDSLKRISRAIEFFLSEEAPPRNNRKTLAEKTKISTASISRIISGKQNITVKNLEKISEYFGKDISLFFKQRP
jgi:transcriptional regulator with XRE-family HTH domain